MMDDKYKLERPEKIQTVDNDDLENSDENERPAGERWAPVGANDGDDDFGDEYKYSNSMESLACDTERLKILEEEQELLNSSLIALTTHFAQVQFRLRQIVDAPASEKENLLKELEEFAFRGIPDVPNNLGFGNRNLSSSTPPLAHNPSLGNNKISGESTNDLSSSSRTMAISLISDGEVESKMALQRTKQRELIGQLKLQLEDLEKYAYETGGAGPPQSVILERQNLIINHLKEKLNFNIDDLCKLPLDDLRWQVDCAISQIVSPLKMKEQLVTQLKTQIADLERFINYLQGEISPESLACTCACPVHTSGGSSSYGRRSFKHRNEDEEVQTKTLNTIRKAVALLHMFALSQLRCTGDPTKKNAKKNSVRSWRDLRTRLDVAVEHVLSQIAEAKHEGIEENDYTSDSDSQATQSSARLTMAVRKHLAISIRDLLHHGLTSDSHASSVVPFIGCFPQRNNTSANSMHIWELILRYYDIKNGHRYNSSPAQKLSRSFNLDLAGGSTVSSKQSLLTTIGNIVASHTPYKRSYDSHFKAFVCAALNLNKLVSWLKLILQSQYLLENYYMSWSYVVKTGFQDGFHTLDRLTNHKFDLPVDLAVRQFQNIKDAF
ncbi:RUN domain-containing protein 1-like [Athalia rosae]|uniref:RUN domain-containing protein 1-like n=1 Tax=Athalia rosae TaxID=37344 RepID=UPI0020337D13|nr:RUN domain-containing protein 1-like [Athalia rosae]XP_012250837.2 RUN domain-containing protein 1-like [Athalia rosae]XP_012250841.2 RUN domain-containing protein 1-like [Athalia rosae]XP_048505567.1 RUN domain-containing protein 1-like [Athalia rosae]XP_048505568.1 RUN domain-containing protein 1-like [Athalia rosae]XP_048505570.1 RUN domain-containing protein 1-like [Athalia rosae]XP_048505571.1 RUN domain-containing protein 1-like [Athalia rosae]XP_048505572.1 RUN domain-containing pr